MQKIFFFFFWMFAFFVVGLFLFGIFNYAVIASDRPGDQTALSDSQELLLELVFCLFPIGLPVLAFLLIVMGKLPVTLRGSN
jgi:hypothetical protein